MRTQRTDFPVLTCAVSCINGKYQAAIGARPARAKLYRDENNILADKITAENAKEFASYIAEHAVTGSNIRGSAAYRTHLTKVLTERSLLELGGM
jgi:CO/xanthine dehydrogenase FAD-binding subunit